MTKPYDANRASGQTKGGWEPKNCIECGKRVLASNGIFHFNLGGEPYSLHHDCAQEVRYKAVK